MASVTNLDQDVKKDREAQVTKQVVADVSAFLERSLQEHFRAGDRKELQAALKDGVVLCRLADVAYPGCVRGYKIRATMPFVQMENIQLFIQACRNTFGLREHDLFVTANLYEDKDMLQVVRCLGAFSRWAHRERPGQFSSEIGGKSHSGALSPEVASANNNNTFGTRVGGPSNASNNSSAYSFNNKPPGTMTPSRTGESSGCRSPVKAGSPGSLSSGGVSSWSKKSDKGATDIPEYGYMGRASQGNMGVTFGCRRQITGPGPYIPNMAEKMRRQREQEAGKEQLRIQTEEDERRRYENEVAEEKRAQDEEQKRWAEETRMMKKKQQEEEKRQWEEEERRWKSEEEWRRREEREAEAKARDEQMRVGARSNSRLQDQLLSRYPADNSFKVGDSANDSPESARVRDLERQLEEARERERRYEQERQSRQDRGRASIEEYDISKQTERDALTNCARSRSRPRLPTRNQWLPHQQTDDELVPPQPPRPLPEPTALALPVRTKTLDTGFPSRPLPDPTAYASNIPPVSTQNRTERFLLSNPSPRQPQASITYSSEIGGFDSVAERDAEDERRAASQIKTKAGGWASKSLLEREMELERQRQQEWEEAQKEVQSKKAKGDGVNGIGGGIGGKWDVNQWTGYTGGDGQNKGGQGIGSGRRQIVGPRPPPGR